MQPITFHPIPCQRTVCVNAPLQSESVSSETRKFPSRGNFPGWEPLNHPSTSDCSRVELDVMRVMCRENFVVNLRAQGTSDTFNHARSHGYSRKNLVVHCMAFSIRGWFSFPYNLADAAVGLHVAINHLIVANMNECVNCVSNCRGSLASTRERERERESWTAWNDCLIELWFYVPCTHDTK